MSIPDVKSVKPLPNFYVEVEYATGMRKRFNAKPYVSSIAFLAPLNPFDLFSTVHPAGNTIEWGNGKHISANDLWENSELVSW